MDTVAEPALSNSEVRVFICYDRSDTQSDARLIYEHLAQRFGREHVFFDVEAIPVGEPFPTHIAERLTASNVFLPIIGRNWAGMRTRGRLDEDFVRTEIALARQHGIPFLPVATSSAQQRAARLEPELQEFLKRNQVQFNAGGQLPAILDTIERQARKLAASYETQRSAAAAHSAEAEPATVEEITEASRLGLNTYARYRDFQYWTSAAGSGFDDGVSDLLSARSTGVEGFERPVLIRRLAPHVYEVAEAVELFLQEIKLAGGLVHPNVQAVLDLGYVEGTHFCVYDELEFSTLEEIMVRARRVARPLSAAKTCRLALALCRALEYTHAREQAVIHGLITPQDVWLTAKGVVMLTGFGFAAVRTSAFAAGTPHDFLGYQAPEAYNENIVVPKSDLFSVGVLLWELSAGRRLFNGPSVEETRALVRRGEVPPLSAVSRVPALDAVVAKFLASDPERRFENAAAAGLALEELLTDIETRRASASVPATANVAPHVDELPSDGKATAAAGAPEQVVERSTAPLGRSLPALQVSQSRAPAEGTLTTGAGLASLALIGGGLVLVWHVTRASPPPRLIAAGERPSAAAAKSEPVASNSPLVAADASVPAELSAMEVESPNPKYALTLVLDGRPVGQLPQHISGLAPGKHTVEISGSDRFDVFRGDVILSPNDDIDFTPHLKVRLGAILVLAGANFGDADVWLASEERTRHISPGTLEEVVVADHERLFASRTGFETFERAIEFGDDVPERKYRVDLVPRAQPTQQPSSTYQPEAVIAPGTSAQPAVTPLASAVTQAQRTGSIDAERPP